MLGITTVTKVIVRNNNWPWLLLWLQWVLVIVVGLCEAIAIMVCFDLGQLNARSKLYERRINKAEYKTAVHSQFVVATLDMIFSMVGAIVIAYR